MAGAAIRSCMVGNRLSCSGSIAQHNAAHQDSRVEYVKLGVLYFLVMGALYWLFDCL